MMTSSQLDTFLTQPGLATQASDQEHNKEKSEKSHLITQQDYQENNNICIKRNKNFEVITREETVNNKGIKLHRNHSPLDLEGIERGESCDKSLISVDNPNDNTINSDDNIPRVTLQTKHEWLVQTGDASSVKNCVDDSSVKLDENEYKLDIQPRVEQEFVEPVNHIPAVDAETVPYLNGVGGGEVNSCINPATADPPEAFANRSTTDHRSFTLTSCQRLEEKEKLDTNRLDDLAADSRSEQVSGGASRRPLENRVPEARSSLLLKNLGKAVSEPWERTEGRNKNRADLDRCSRYSRHSSAGHHTRTPVIPVKRGLPHFIDHLEVPGTRKGGHRNSGTALPLLKKSEILEATKLQIRTALRKFEAEDRLRGSDLKLMDPPRRLERPPGDERPGRGEDGLERRRNGDLRRDDSAESGSTAAQDDGSPDEISVASTEIVTIKQKRRKNGQEKRVRSYSADRVLDDNLTIPLVPLVNQSAGCDVRQTVVRQTSSSSNRQLDNNSCIDNSCLDSSFCHQDSFSSRLDSSLSRQDSEDIQSPVLRCSTSRSSYWNRTPGTSSYWGQRRSYTNSMLVGTLSKSYSSALDRQSYTNIRHSTDILDKLEIAKPTRSKLDEIESGLYLGNIDAATDVLTLKSHRVSHIITVDSVPLPRKITSLLPRLACMHIQVTDIPSEDLLSHFPEAVKFIEEGLRSGVVLVHCYYGKSRSATIVTAYLMYKRRLTVDSALHVVKSKRSIVSPNPGFKAQLRLWEAMKWRLEATFLRYKMYKLHLVSERMRKAKLISRDALLPVIEDDQTRSRSASVIYKCRECRKPLATSNHLVPHISGENPYWYTPIWKHTRTNFCTQSVYLSPLNWMSENIRKSLSGKLSCPDCNSRLGEFSWVMGLECGCGASVSPGFRLDMTAIIFKTGSRQLQSSGREPVMV